MSNKRKDRSGKGRAADEPEKFPKTPHDCDHTDTPWNIGGEIHNMRSDLPGEAEKPAGERELVGHCLQIANVKCLGCGQVFRFTNVPTSGNMANHPVMLNSARDLWCKIEPDLLIVQPNELSTGSRIARPGTMRVPKRGLH